jgi:hypothetical protein
MTKKVARNNCLMNSNFYYKNLSKKIEEDLIEVRKSLQNNKINNSLIYEII